MRWPAEQAGTNNRLLALAAGVDLQGEEADLGFRLVEGRGRLSRNARRLEARGFFAARAAHLGGAPTTVVENANGTVSPGTLLLALDGPERSVRPRPLDAPLPETGLVVYEALAWDDAFALADRVSGRTMILEYPPAEGDGWSRYWLRGPWPAGAPTEADLEVPGLVRAREALALILRPREFRWATTEVGRWGGANRWLEHGHGAAEASLFAWFTLGAFVLAWALAQVMNEDRGPFVSELLLLLALSPAAIVLAGAAGRFGGLEGWPVWLVLSGVGLYGVARLLGLALRRLVPEAHPLLAACLVGLASLVAFDPLWSDFSGRFGRLDVDVPAQAVGALAAYLTGAAAFARGRWWGRALVAAFLLWGATTHPWWVSGHSAFLLVPALALAAAEGVLRPIHLLVLALLPTGIWRMVREGVSWNAGGLLAFADERGSTNLWTDAALLLSPQWVGTLAFVATVGLVGNRFLAYRLGRLLRQGPPIARAAVDGGGAARDGRDGTARPLRRAGRGLRRAARARLRRSSGERLKAFPGAWT